MSINPLLVHPRRCMAHIFSLSMVRFLVAVLFACCTLVTPAYAVETTGETGFDLPAEYTGTVTVKRDYNQPSVKNSISSMIRKVRERAYNENWKFNGTMVQAYVKSKGLSKATYLNAYSWDTTLEKASIQLSNEFYVTGQTLQRSVDNIGSNTFQINGEYILNDTDAFDLSEIYVYGGSSWSSFPATEEAWKYIADELKNSNGAFDGNTLNTQAVHMMLRVNAFYGASSVGNSVILISYNKAIGNNQGTNWTGQHTVKVPVGPFTYYTGDEPSITLGQVSQEQITGKMPDAVYIDDASLPVGQTILVKAGTAPVTKLESYKSAVFTPNASVPKYSGDQTYGTPASFTLDPVIKNKTEIPGNAPIYRRGTGTSAAVDLSPDELGFSLSDNTQAVIVRKIDFNTAKEMNAFKANLKAFRTYAYDHNAFFEGTTLRNYLNKRGISREAYINSFKWDSELEKAAIRFALEEQIEGQHFIRNAWQGYNDFKHGDEYVFDRSRLSIEELNSNPTQTDPNKQIFDYFDSEIERLNKTNGKRTSEYYGSTYSWLDPDAYYGAYSTQGTNSHVVLSYPEQKGSSSGLNWTGTHTLKFGVAPIQVTEDGPYSELSLFGKSRRVTTKEMPPTEYLYTDELYVGETKVVDSGAVGDVEYTLTTAGKYYRVPGNAGEELLSAESYDVSATKINYVIKSGRAPVVKVGSKIRTNTEGNTGGSTGGNTGGNTGGSTGGNTGGNTGGSTGGNTGGNTGGSTDGNTGGNTSGNTGGSTTDVSQGQYNGIYIINSVYTTKDIDISGGSKKDSGNAIMWEDNGAPNQRFKLTHVKDGYYTIKCINSGKYLDIQYGLKTPGANVIQYAYTGRDNQLWKIVPTGRGVSFVSKLSGLTIDVMNQSTKNGANVATWSKTGGLNQQFRLIPTKISTIATNMNAGVFSSALNRNNVMDIMFGSYNNGASTLAYMKNGGKNQEFAAIYNENDGYYYLLNQKSAKYLDVEYGKAFSGARVLQWQFTGGMNQKWDLREMSSDGQLQIRTALGGYVADIYGGSSRSGAKVILWKANGGLNQRWYYEQYNF